MYSDLFIKACRDPVKSFLNKEFSDQSYHTSANYGVYAWTDSTPILGVGQKKTKVCSRDRDVKASLTK